MPAKKLKQLKQIREKLPATAVGKSRKTQYEPVDGKRNVVSQIPVVRRQGRPSLSAKFDPTVDINDALKRLGKGFFVGEEKDLFKTPLKVKPVDSQKQSPFTGPTGTPSRSNKRGARGSVSSSRGSPGSTTSSPDSPYFLRSKGTADEVVDDSSLRRKRRQRSVGSESAEKESPAGRTKPVGLDSAERKTPAGKRKSGGLGSAEKESQGRKAKSVVKESPARRGRKSTQSPPRKKAEVEKPESLKKDAKAGSSARKDKNQESSVRDKERVKSVKKDAAKTAAESRRQTKASQDLTSEENADDVLRVETGKKRKREEDDEVDDPKTKRAKIVLVDSAKIREMVQEPNQKPATMRLMVHRANIDDKTILDSDNEQPSHRQLEETKSVENKSKTPASAFKEVNQTKKEQSRRTTTEVTTVVTTSSRNRSSIFGSVNNNNALSDSVQRLREAAARNRDEAAHIQPHDLTANISVRSSWSAHLYDKGNTSASKVPLTPGNSQRRSMDALRPLSVVMPSVDFQMKWDTSAVKEQLLNSVLPQTPRTNKLDAISMVSTGKDANSRPRGKGLLESVAAFSATSVVTPLKRSDVDKSMLETDVVELGEGVRLRTTRKTVHTEEEVKTIRPPSLGRYSAVPFNMQVQPLRGNGTGMRHSVDRMLTPTAAAADRVDAIRGRSVEPGMIRGESVVRMRPKFNGQLVVKEQMPVASKEQLPVVEMGRERCGRVCRRLLCVAGTSVLVIGALFLVQLAMAAGYLGEFF